MYSRCREQDLNANPVKRPGGSRLQRVWLREASLYMHVSGSTYNT